MPRPRLKDVAELAGTSTAVVSYVVNGGPRPVAPETRQRVEQAIATLGYRPNVVARGLRRQETGTYGLVVPDLASSFFAELAAAVEDAAAGAGHRLLIGSARFDPERELEQVAAMIDAQVDGVVVVPAEAPDRADTLLRHSGARWVRLHRHVIAGEESVRAVVGADESAGRTGVDHLLAHGHTRIACLGGPGVGAPVRRRMDGYRRGMRDALGGVDEGLVVECSYRDLVPAAYRAALKLLRDDRTVTAVLAATDEHALGTYRAAAELGLRVGEDLAVVSIDGTAWSAHLQPGLTVLRAPFEQMGVAAVESLRDGAASEGAPLRYRLVTRRSCGC